MDVSPEYIKMCKQGYPILGKKKPEEGDYWYIENKRDGGREVMLISGYNTDSGVYGPGIENDGDLHGWKLLFPIYRQDQLQAMIALPSQFHRICDKLYAFTEWVKANATYESSECTMEQLWLAFMMKEKYGKTWNWREWVTL